MTCDSVIRLLASNAPLSAAALEHLRQCPGCRAADLCARGDAAPAVPPELAQRLAAIVCDGLTPVRPLRSGSIYWSGLAAAAVAIMAAGVSVLGHRGWIASSVMQRSVLAASIAAGLLLASALLVRLMAPGSALFLRPRVFAVAMCCVLVVDAGVYPLAMYPHFAKALAACFSIGLAHAIPVMAIVLWILRKGYVLPAVTTAIVAGVFSGLTGFAVLFIFCPHLDAGHYVLAHVGMVAACTAAAPLLSGFLSAAKPPR